MILVGRVEVLNQDSEFKLSIHSPWLSTTMDSIFEIQRQTHEEIERLERALSTLLSRPASTQEQRLKIEQKASQILDRIFTRSTALHNLYEDQEAKKAEQDALSAPTQQNDLSEFYSRLVKIQEHHNKYPDAVPAGFDLEIAAFLDEPGQEDDYEEEDRRYPCLLNYTLPDTLQLLPYSSLARRVMDAISISTPTIPPIATSKISVNGQVISNILIFSLRLKTVLFTLIYQRKRAFRRILKRVFALTISE